MFNELLINKDNLINNIKQVKQRNSHSLICAMVKANAYGLGLEEIVKISSDYVDFFGVACFFEACQVKSLTNKKILIAGALDKAQINEDFSYTCSSLEDVEFLAKQNKPICVHLKINSGMNRFGFRSIREFKKSLSKIKKSKLILEGLFTHFATTDNYVGLQMSVFKKYISLVHKFGFDPIIHTDNSAVNKIQNHNLDMVRIGFDLFNQNKDGFLPVANIRTQIVQINLVHKNELVGYDKRFIAKQKTKVAVFPLGYADGFDLRFIGMKLNFKGKECKVLNVCMDCFMLDVSNLNVKKGDDLFVLNNINSLTRYAKYINVSEYQISTNFSKIRASRIII